VSEQVSIRERAKRAYEERAGSVRARLVAQRTKNQEEEVAWLKEVFGHTLEDFAAEGIKARVHRHPGGGITGLQIEGTDLFTNKETWSISCVTWAELGEQLDPDTFEAYTPTDEEAFRMIAADPSNLPTWDNDAY